MNKTRTAVPKGTRDEVLSEFNHRCAVCGADRPHLHHIDEDPSNNDPLNLLPLCPNCHLGDEHNPTAGIGSRLLGMFRRFKDPAILVPQFQPLYKRLEFLSAVEVNEDKTTSLEEASEELVSFVRALQMGSFYGDRIEQLVQRPKHPGVFRLDGKPDPEAERARRRHNREYREQLAAASEGVVALVVEQLRFQEWE